MNTIKTCVVERLSGIMQILPLTVFYDPIIAQYAMPMNITCDTLWGNKIGIKNAKFNRKLRNGCTVYKEERLF